MGTLTFDTQRFPVPTPSEVEHYQENKEFCKLANLATILSKDPHLNKSFRKSCQDFSQIFLLRLFKKPKKVQFVTDLLTSEQRSPA